MAPAPQLIFRILADNVPRPAAEGHPKTSWISQETRRLMAKRCGLRRDEHHSRQQARVLASQIDRSLQQDRKARAAAVGAEIEACLEKHDPQGAWNIAGRWCRFAGDRPSQPQERTCQP